MENMVVSVESQIHDGFDAALFIYCGQRLSRVFQMHVRKHLGYRYTLSYTD